MIKKINLLSFFLSIFTCSVATKEHNQKFNYSNFLHYPNSFTNGAIGLSLGFLSLKLLNKKKPPFLKSFPYLEAVSYGVSIIFPFLINVWKAKKLYNKLSYDYIMKNFDSVKRHDYWFDKLAMIDDLKINLLEKSGFKRDSVSYQKYNVLLDILTKSPKKIIDELKDYDQQENFLSAALLLDAEKVRGLKLDYLTSIKEALKETGVLEKKFSDSLFFNTSEVINDFLHKVHPPIAAQFIVEYKDDMKGFIDSFINLEKTKQQYILSAMRNQQKREKNQGLIRIITDQIVFDIIVETFDKSNEAACSLLENLSDENFWSLISYVSFKQTEVNFKDKIDDFSKLIKYFYEQNRETPSDKNNPFIKKTNFIMKKDEENKTNIGGWWLSKAGYTKKQSQETKPTVNLPQKPKDNNYQNHPAAMLPLKNSSAQARLTQLFSIKS